MQVRRHLVAALATLVGTVLVNGCTNPAAKAGRGPAGNSTATCPPGPDRVAGPSAGWRYVPRPEAVDTGSLRVGAILCPLWQGGTRWRPIVPYLDRQPLLGWYDEGDPEVTDWEVTWALDHGISFFLVCWYRQPGNVGQLRVEPALGHWLHDGLFRSRYGDAMQFAILWENGHANALGLGPYDAQYRAFAAEHGP